MLPTPLLFSLNTNLRHTGTAKHFTHWHLFYSLPPSSSAKSRQDSSVPDHPSFTLCCHVKPTAAYFPGNCESTPTSMIDSQARIRHACKNNSINNLKPLWYAQLLLPLQQLSSRVCSLVHYISLLHSHVPVQTQGSIQAKKISSGLEFSVEQITLSWDKEK